MRIDWSDYLRVHANRSNLLIHLVAVPLFIAALATLASFVIGGNWTKAFFAFLATVAAMAMQGRGHRMEISAPRPFSGPGNFLRRWFSEQFVIFPLFVLSGRWLTQYRTSNTSAEHES